MPETNLYAIKKRVIAAKQTRKITSTMEQIASSRLYHGKMLLRHFKGYQEHIKKAADSLPDRYFTPLSGPKSAHQKAYIVFGGSKGLSGSYGPNLFSYAEPITVGNIVLAVGSATEAFFPKAEQAFLYETPTPEGSDAIGKAAKALYESRTVGEVYLIYMRGTRHILQRLLPLSREAERAEGIIIEPSRKALFPQIHDMYIESLVYGAHLHAFIAEQIARIAAMNSATQNADDIIAGLESSYNRIRQAGITQEIIMLSNAGRGEGYDYEE